MENQQPNLKLQAFEGPLDLLLHLIEKNKIDIYDIPIFEITRQYLDYLKQWDDLNMEVASEFIVMAATLINIKARRLLPLAERTEQDDEDEEAALIARLLEYKRFKEAGRSLGAHLRTEGELFLWRSPESIQGERPIPSPAELLEKVSLEQLHELMLRAERSKKESFDAQRAGFRSVRKEQYTVKEKIAFLRRKLVLTERLSFMDLRKSSRSKEETVTYFMALLELSRMSQITMNQQKAFGDILIERNQDAPELSEAETDYEGGA